MHLKNTLKDYFEKWVVIWMVKRIKGYYKALNFRIKTVHSYTVIVYGICWFVMCRLSRKVQKNPALSDMATDLFFRLNTLCTHMFGSNLWNLNVLLPLIFNYCSVQNFVSRCHVQSHCCRNSHADQGCTKRVQPGKTLK